MLYQNAAAFSRAQRILIDTTHPVAGRAPRGLMAGTRIETATGWRPVERLASGDLVHTRDGGLKPVVRVDRSFYRGPRGPEGLRGVLRVPGGALMNCTPMLLLPDQHVMFDTPFAEAVLGTPLTLVPGRALNGFRGIHPVRVEGPSEVVTLRFAEEEIVWANTGVMVHCPALGEDEAEPFRSDFFTVLDGARAEALLGLIEIGATDTGELGRTEGAFAV
jgi:hypothetical protein